ncbi:uncharacterized protein LOC124953450 isoform X1 [Vespa velutina]|uniref:uncharacterized protein LOC124953450 isoform X1 n=1 Tax=Vespa velutina TaxID=202808 RepID=UPI001FB291F8|nr:uncharacterized protein LOC124953450 isoform X1 [Vespa velutina]
MGLRSYQNSNDLFVQVCTVVIYMFPIIVHQFYQLAISDVTFQSTIKVLQKMLITISILGIYTAVYYSFEHMKQIFSQLKFDYQQLSDEDELEIMEKYNKEGKMYTYTIIGFFNFYLIVIVIPSIFNIFWYHIDSSDNVILTFPIPINNVLKPGPIYYSLLIYQIIGIFGLMIIGCICFSYYLLLILHACCQLRVIRMKTSQPFRDHRKLNQKTKYDKKILNEFGWIIEIIEHYKRVTKFVDLLNTTTKTIYLIVMCFVMFLIVLNFLYIFHLSAALTDTWELIECGVYIIGSTLITYINMYLGQTLMTHSIEAHAELSKIPFYMISIRVQKILVFMMLRSSKPCILSIGGIFVASHEFFAGLMRKAFSFAMAYRSVH